MICPLCKKEVTDHEWFPGVNKCRECFSLVGELRRSGKAVLCLRLIYGRVEE